MNHLKLSNLLSLSNEAQDWLRSELIKQFDYRTYRELAEITGLDLKQLKRIVEGKTTIKTEALTKACQGLLSNPTKGLSRKKAAS